MEKIAQLFEVPVDMLLDDYNLFLRNGQGKQIKAIRTKLGLTQREYADKLSRQPWQSQAVGAKPQADIQIHVGEVFQTEP